MLQLKRTLISASVLVALTACGGGDKNTAPFVKNESFAGGQVWVPITGSMTATDLDGDPLSVTAISENGQTIIAKDGVYQLKNGTLVLRGPEFSYTALKPEGSVFTYTVSDGKESSTATIKIGDAKTDPLADQQWHLRNTGQKAYAMSDSLIAQYSLQLQRFLGWTKEAADARALKRADASVLKPNEDMNVMGAYALGATGKNTIAVVVDSGLEINHEDLVANVLPNRSLNLVPGAVDPTNPTNLATGGDHGTSVAGLIAATGWNDLGGRGVAPDTQLIGMNYLLKGAQTARNGLLIHGHPGSGIGVDEPIAVFNRSYGVTVPAAIAYSEQAELIQAYSAKVLRSGKGVVNVKAAGNSFLDGNEYDADLCYDNGANTLGLTCYNGALEPSQNTPYYLTVAAVNSDGRHTSYSTAGANLLVSAPAGEYGTFAPAMVTTDQMTCLRGYSSFTGVDTYDKMYWPGFFAGYFPFNNPGHKDNISCNYTSTFNGTSSAAPNASGVVSLMLSANPNLSYRDVRDILVQTSTKVDATNKAVTLSAADGKFVAHQGWVKNKAGYEFNNNYGFGRVDAGKAVALAKKHTGLPAEKVSDWKALGSYAADKKSLAQNVPDNSVVGTEMSIVVTDDIKLEGAQFKFTISNPEYGYGIETADGLVQTTAGIDLAIEVTSPAGTRSVLLSSKQALIYPALNADFSDNPGYVLKDTVLLSNAFYGESAKGTWKIRVLDVNGGNYASAGGILEVDAYVNNTKPSKVDGVALRVFGH